MVGFFSCVEDFLYHGVKFVSPHLCGFPKVSQLESLPLHQDERELTPVSCSVRGSPGFSRWSPDPFGVTSCVPCEVWSDFIFPHVEVPLALAPFIKKVHLCSGDLKYYLYHILNLYMYLGLFLGYLF